MNLVLISISIFTLLLSATVNKAQKPIDTNTSLAAQERPSPVLAIRSKAKISPTNIVTITIAPQPTVQSSPTPIPQQQSQLKVGIVVDDYSNKFGTIPALENKVGNNFSTVGIYKHFGLVGNKDVVPSDLNYIKANGKTLLLTWEPWNPNEGMNQSRDFLKEIASGSQDAYINKFISDLKTYGGKVILRFGHEMNGNWYPWGQRPDDYKAAFKKISEKLKTQNASNITLNWSINSDTVPYEDISNVNKFYPGDSYVDSISIDGYNWGTSRPGNGWRTFSQVFEPSYNYLVKTYSKPLFIAETASSEEGGKKDEWITQMFSESNTKFPKITEIVWFNLLKETDWRIESSNSSLSAFKENLTNTP